MCRLCITNTDTLKEALCKTDFRFCYWCCLPLDGTEMSQEVICSTSGNSDTPKMGLGTHHSYNAKMMKIQFSKKICTEKITS